MWRNLTKEKVAKLVEFTLEKKNSKIFPIYLLKNSEISPPKKKKPWVGLELTLKVAIAYPLV